MRNKFGLKMVAGIVGMALSVCVFPASALASQPVQERAVTYTVRIDGDGLAKTTVKNFPGETGRQQGPATTFMLYDKMNMPGLIPQTVNGLIQVKEFPDLSKYQITNATLHMNTTETSRPMLLLRETTTAWDPTTVTWNTKPGYSADICNFDMTGSPADYNFDITEIVQKWTPESNKGLMLELNRNNSYFSVGDADDYIEIQYTPKKTVKIDDSNFMLPGIYNHPDLQWTNFGVGQAELMKDCAWNGYNTTAHGLLQVTNLPNIGKSVVSKATLYLMSSTTEKFDIGMREITSSWDPYSIVWGAQPDYAGYYTGSQQKYGIPTDYAFDITDLVNTWYQTGVNHGVMFEMLNSGGNTTLYRDGGWIEIEYYGV